MSPGPDAISLSGSSDASSMVTFLYIEVPQIARILRQKHLQLV